MGTQEAEQLGGEVRSPGFQLPKQSFIWKWQAAEPGFGDETMAGGLGKVINTWMTFTAMGLT